MLVEARREGPGRHWKKRKIGKWVRRRIHV
jgi:hypothetical protein